MPKSEILKILDAVRLVIATQNISDEEAEALFIAAAKSLRTRLTAVGRLVALQRNRKVE